MKIAIHGALGNETDFATKTTVLGVFDFPAFLNLAMLMTENGGEYFQGVAWVVDASHPE